MCRIEERPLVSFVVPTYNSGRDVLITLASIMRQDFRDFEVLVTDDGSEPVYVEELKQRVSGFPGSEKIRLIENPENRGIIPNLQSAYLQARGRYIKVLSPGDLLYGAGVTEKMLSCIGKSPVPFVVGLQRAYRIDVAGGVRDEPGFLYPGPREMKIRDHYTAFQVMLRRGFLNGPTFFFERSFYIENCWLPAQVKYLGDYSIALVLAWQGVFPSYCNSFFVHYQFGSGITTKGSSSWEAKIREDNIGLFDWLGSDQAPPPCDPLLSEYVKRHRRFSPFRSSIPKKIEQVFRFPLNWFQYSFELALAVLRNSSSTRAEKKEAYYSLVASDGDGFLDMIREFYGNSQPDGLLHDYI